MATESVDFEVVREIGAALPEVKVSSGKRGLALKIDGRLLACQAIHKSAEANTLMVSIGQDRREELLATNGATYYLTDHYKPYPAVLVRLSRIQRASLEQLLSESRDFVRQQQA